MKLLFYLLLIETLLGTHSKLPFNSMASIQMFTQYLYYSVVTHIHRGYLVREMRTTCLLTDLAHDLQT